MQDVLSSLWKGSRGCVHLRCPEEEFTGGREVTE